MIKLTVTVEIDEDEYKQALAEAWNERFGEDIGPEDIRNLENVQDFHSAASNFLPEEVFKSIVVTKVV